MTKDELIGKKIEGFSFEDDPDFKSAYNLNMDEFIGLEGTITSVQDIYVQVDFEDDFWLYPIVLINDHLIN